MQIPDLRKKPVGRTTIDQTNVTLEDIVERIANRTDGGVNSALGRFEETAESRFGRDLNRRLDEVIETCELMKRRVNDIRYELNSEDRERRIRNS